MRKFSEQPQINTDFTNGLTIPNSKHYEDNQIAKYKSSSPTIFGDMYRIGTPIQWQLSPIELSRREKETSGISENFDFSVKSHCFNEPSRQSSTYMDNEMNRLQAIIFREQVLCDEQEQYNRKVKKIREEAYQKLYQLEIQYIEQRRQLIRGLNQQLSVKMDPPLKSALKKKESTRHNTSEKEQYRYEDEDSQEDWNFIRQAKVNLQKQKTQQHYVQEEKSPSKVRFVNTKEYYQQKKFRKQQEFTNMLRCRP